MISSRASIRRRWTPQFAFLAAAAALLAPLSARARVTEPPPADKVHVLDGTTALTVGRLHVYITNWGLIGSRYSELSSYGDAPSGQWPGGSGNEYLFAGGLWIGGIQRGEAHVSTGQPEAELRPETDPEATLYEAREGRLVRPPNPGAGGVPWYLPGGDDDGDGRLDEEILDGHDNDGDGRIDEDFGQLGTQMFVASMFDNTPLAVQSYPDHVPLDVRVEQTAVAWQTSEQQDFVVLSYKITNVGALDIQDLYAGFWTDCDIGPRTDPDASQNDLAGTFDEYVRVPAGHYQPVRGGYMRDAAPHDRLPGWFAVQLVHHPTDQNRVRAPYPEGVRGVHIISRAGSIANGGPPLNDSERYELLSREGRDEDISEDRAYDYSFLVSAGPFSLVEPGQTVEFAVALCVGDGREAMLDACAAAQDTYFGRWVDADADAATGVGGRETLVCAEDFYPQWDSSLNPIYARNTGIWNPLCAPPMTMPDITPARMILYPLLRKHCIWVNADNCEECERVSGASCLNSGGSEGKALQGPYTGLNGCETQAPWVVQVMPPPAPSTRIDAGDGVVRIFWDDRSEWVADDATGALDFESYRLWRSDLWDRPPGSSLVTGPSRDSWRLVAEFDLENQYRVSYPGNIVRWLDLGPNTGLEGIEYHPVCLDDPRYRGIAGPMWRIVQADSLGRLTYRPSLRDARGRPVEGLEELLPWEDDAAVLDTFFAVTPRKAAPPGVAGKHATRYYRYDDTNVHNGYLYFYAVTAMDHALSPAGIITGFGIQGTPGAAFFAAQPRFNATRPNPGAEEAVYVYPNPATRERLQEFQGMSPSGQDPTGVRVAFANLPAARVSISIYTLAGDRVVTLEHDGRQGDGQVYWNLISYKGQEVVSGIYLYVVEPHDPGFTQSIGKFVVIR